MVASLKNIEENCLEVVFKNLPLKDKFRYRSVCRKWKNLLDKIIKNQNSLALFDKMYPLQNGEENAICKHKLNDQDIILSKVFEWKQGAIGQMLKRIPKLRHLNIRILDKEQLEKMTDELVEDIEKLDCIELPFSSVLLKFVDKFSETLKYIDCCYFNTNETLIDMIVSCDKLEYIYMIGCPEFTSDILKVASSSKLTYVYTMERIFFSGFEDKFPNKTLPKNLKGIGFITAKDLPLVCTAFPGLVELLVEFHQGYCPLLDLVKLKNLENLYIREYNRRKSLDENLIYIFKNCPKLKSLNLQNVNVSDVALKEIPNYCKKLEKLYINNVQMDHFSADSITDRCIKPIIEAKTNIKSINIQGPNSITYKNGLTKTKLNDSIDIYTCKK